MGANVLSFTEVVRSTKLSKSSSVRAEIIILILYDKKMNEDYILILPSSAQTRISRVESMTSSVVAFGVIAKTTDFTLIKDLSTFTVFWEYGVDRNEKFESFFLEK